MAHTVRALLALLVAGLAAAGSVKPLELQQQQAQAGNQTQAKAQQPNYLETGRQITGILDRFMSLGYDKRVRPNYGGPPVEVNVTMRILSISSVSEVMMDFTADFYFRQTWHDPRLSFKKLGDIQTLYVGAEVSKKIWLPDTFFGNEKLAYFHEATTPNVFLRIDHSGEVYRSIRLTVTSSCPMNLQYFPMDKQRCTIEAESYGYNVKDIIYKWARKETAVERDKEISLPQFDIVKTVQKYRLEELSSGTYSRLIAEIHFARRMGYYLIQIYIPSSLIVVISWVSFWLHRNASPARVQLGVTTVLTMTTLMSSTNSALPKISYVKSIDIFLGTCFIMVFAALLEYATVGYLGKRIAMRKSQVQHAQTQANARLFAQLQAQGAQGDSVPPSAAGSAPLLGPLACATGDSSVAAAARANLAASLQQQQASPLLRQVAQQALLQQQLHSGRLEPPPRAPERRCNHQSLSHGTGHYHLQGQPDCELAGQSHHQHCCWSSAGARQKGPNRKHRHLIGQSSADNACEHCQLPSSQLSSHTLPRNFLSVGGLPPVGQVPCHQHAQSFISPTAAFEAQALEKSMHEATSGNFDSSLLMAAGFPLSPNMAAGYQLPPSYGGKATAAAAATFVNLHRKQKGLPPSNNPNFTQFSWIGQSDRSLETIFGIRPSDIDKYSRVVFPVCFVCFQLMYWIVYLHISAFLEPDQQLAI